MEFVSFILEHVSKILFFTQDFWAMKIVLGIADWLKNFGKKEDVAA